MLRTAAFLAALALPSVARADDPPAAAENASGWWTSFGSASLSALVERALAGNLGLEERRLRLREARLGPAVPRSLLWPAHLDIEGSLSRFREQFASEDQNVSGTFALADWLPRPPTIWTLPEGVPRCAAQPISARRRCANPEKPSRWP